MMLEGKVILVAGAAGLLGKALVESICQEGGKVIAADINEMALQSWLADKEWAQGQVRTTVLDICNRESINAALKFSEDAWGRLDGAVNSSYPRNKNYGRKFFDVEYEDFCTNMSLHLGGYFLFMQQIANYVKENSLEFSLVNISSIYGVIAPKLDIYKGTNMTMSVEYAAIKSGILHMNRYLTEEMKGTEFRVNAVSPGGIEDGQPAEFLDNYGSYCRKKGMLEVEDVLGPILFLLSEKSKYICGENIVVDDGFSN